MFSKYEWEPIVHSVAFLITNGCNQIWKISNLSYILVKNWDQLEKTISSFLGVFQESWRVLVGCLDLFHYSSQLLQSNKMHNNKDYPHIFLALQHAKGKYFLYS